MTTSYSSIIKKFEDNLSQKDVSNLELFTERQFLRNAISMYKGTIGLLTANNQQQLIEEDLNDVELLILSLLMYDSYLEQEIIRYNKTLNISNEFMQISGASNRVKTLVDRKSSNQSILNNIISNMM